MPNYHIGKDGTPKICKAREGNCPLGGMTTHYNDLENARVAADTINEQLANIQGMAVAKVDGNIVLNKKAQEALVRLSNLQRTVGRLQALRERARETIVNEMFQKGVKSISSEVGKISYIKDGTRTSISSEKFWKAHENDESLSAYVKEIEYSEFISIHYDDSIMMKSYIKSVNTVEGDVVDFKLDMTQLDDKGTPILSPQAEATVKELREFELSLDKIQQTEKLVKSKFIEEMKDKDISQITLGKTLLQYIPDGIKKTPDSKALREAGLYDQYSQTKDVKKHVRIKYR